MGEKNSPSFILLIQRRLPEFLATVPEALMLGFDPELTENIMENEACCHSIV